MFVEKNVICCFDCPYCKFAANPLEDVLVLVTEVLLFLVLPWLRFVSKDCGLQPFLSQLLKSMRGGLTQCFLTVKSDYDSFTFGGNFCTARLSREALFKSASYDSDLKTPTRLDMAAE